MTKKTRVDLQVKKKEAGILKGIVVSNVKLELVLLIALFLVGVFAGHYA